MNGGCGADRHRIAVIYAGQIVEIGDAKVGAVGAKHAYTKKLIAAVRPSPGGTSVSSWIRGRCLRW